MAQELPISLAELMNIQPELSESLPRAEGRVELVSCGESEQVVLQHLLAALNANTLADEMGQPNLNKVLKLEQRFAKVFEFFCQVSPIHKRFNICFHVWPLRRFIS